LHITAVARVLRPAPVAAGIWLAMTNSDQCSPAICAI
jgi:hypothetical protein